ncbi:unnamed protein product [Larinioides sclopetarius]|uniref:Elongation of very long chain fatty acids protein n=1 Tax=Larinioides sclopetarius TaxID=280406 RepID=A0AAV2ASH2_9ARAC
MLLIFLRSEPNFGATLTTISFSLQGETKYTIMDYRILFPNRTPENLIIAVYLLFIFWIGPAFMRNRKPYTLKKTLICYNFLQSALNAYLSYQVILGVWGKWDLRCNVRHNPNFDEIAKASIQNFYYYYYLKFVDLLDTVFFVLRKKKNQLTFLHVIHHAGMVIIINWCLQYFREASAHYIIICLLMNTIVHVIMYFYYGLAAFGGRIRKYLWWKKYLTLVQIIQIFCMLIYMAIAFLTGCDEFRIYEKIVFSFFALNFFLFINFYKKSKKE